MSVPAFEVRDRVTAPGSPFSAVERLVALCVANHMSAEGLSWPSLTRIASWTGLGVTAIRKALVRLCTGPEAIFLREPGGARDGSRYQSARYRLKGIAARGAQETRGSSSDVEGSAPRARGVRHATPNGSTKGSGNGSTDKRKESLSLDGTLDALTDKLTKATVIAMPRWNR